jgi:hypothetical protein
VEGLDTLLRLAVVDHQRDVHLLMNSLQSGSIHFSLHMCRKQSSYLSKGSGEYLGRPLRDHLDVNTISPKNVERLASRSECKTCKIINWQPAKTIHQLTSILWCLHSLAYYSIGNNVPPPQDKVSVAM